jgi:hypothetical protein
MFYKGIYSVSILGLGWFYMLPPTAKEVKRHRFVDVTKQID